MRDSREVDPPIRVLAANGKKALIGRVGLVNAEVYRLILPRHTTHSSLEFLKAKA